MILTSPDVAGTRGIIADGTSTSVLVYKTSIREDVVLKIQGSSGATLALWSPTFLNQMDSSAGVDTLTLPASALQQDSYGRWYLLALLQAPPLPDNNIGLPQTVEVEASQASLGTPSTSTIALLPRPILLVHGLWSSSAAFVPMESYLLQENNTYVDITPNETISGSSITNANSKERPYAPVYRACYSTLIPWDYDPQQGTLPTGSGVCQAPSVVEIHQDLNSIYDELDFERVVGGRVDVIGHSMGGLALRHFAGGTVYNYNSIRDRGQGRYATLLTLDTPHLGSAFADWLVAMAREGAIGVYPGQVQIPLLAQNLWLAKCDEEMLLSDCLADNLGNPLSFPGDTTFAKGAVGSLQLGYRGLTDYVANPVQIQNTVVGMIESVSPVDESNEYYQSSSGRVYPLFAFGNNASVERAALSSLVAAVSDEASAIDIASSFNDSTHQCDYHADDGHCFDDVIVAVDSQSSQLAPARPFVGLAHNTVGWLPLLQMNVLESQTALDYLTVGIATQPVTFSDANVMTSSSVWKKVLCWVVAVNSCEFVVDYPDQASSASTVALAAHSLAMQRSSNGRSVVSLGPAPSDKEYAASKSSNSATAHAHVLLGIHSRTLDHVPDVTLESTDARLVLGKPAILRFKKAGVMPSFVFISQLARDESTRKMVTVSPESDMAPVALESDGTGRISFIPSRSGLIRVRVFAIIPGEGEGHFVKTIDVTVGGPIDTPVKFYLRGTREVSDHGRVRLTLTPKSKWFLEPMMRSQDTPTALQVDQHSVNYKVISNVPGVITLNPSTGEITPLAVGHAVIEASYSGKRSFACIVVNADEGSSATSPEYCSDLTPSHSETNRTHQ